MIRLTKSVSIIIPTYNRKKALRIALRSLFNQTYPKDRLEIIVVDGGSDGTGIMVKSLMKASPCELKYLRQEGRGIAAARNLGIKNAEGEIIAFTDDDCLVSSNWLAGLVKHFNDPKVGGVGSIREASNKDELLAEAWDLAYITIGSLQKKYEFLNNDKNSLYLCTSSAAYRSQVLRELGGFDEKLTSGEDVDLSYRVIEKGYKLVLEPSAKVRHRHPSTWAHLIKQQIWFGKGDTQLGKKYKRTVPVLKLLLGLFVDILWAMRYIVKIESDKLKVIFPLFILVRDFSRLFGQFYKGSNEKN